jgi:cytochrome c
MRRLISSLMLCASLGMFLFPAIGHAQDADKGAKIYKTRCTQCHTIEQGGSNKVGPALYGVVACKAGTVAGFSYTAAMTNSGISWTSQNLNSFLSNPKKFLPGTKMIYSGLKKDADRNNLIAYITQFRNASAPLNACGR